MKIAEISSTFPPYLAGTGNVCYHNSVELANLGHKVTVYTSKYPKISYTYPKNINVNRFDYLFKVGNAFFIPQLLKIENYDIIHLHYPFFFGAELIYLNAKFRKIKYVVTYYNNTISDGLFGLFFKIYGSTMMKMILNQAEKIFVTSLYYGKNSFLSKMYDNNPDKIIEKYNVENKKIILFVGGLDKPHFFKGIEILFESFRKLNNPDYHLIIVGDGDLRGDYINQVKNLGLISPICLPISGLTLLMLFNLHYKVFKKFGG
ncbi:MAG: glycosyltransferase [Candidatus Methanoperedens sp.]|nr:glycosyltransferase [Candidatus Methanoperedens sp.]